MLTPEQENSARNLWQSVRNIHRSAAHLDVLMDSLKEMIEGECFDGGEVRFNSKIDDEYAGNNWISMSRSMHAEIWTEEPADRRRRPRQFGTISIHLIIHDGSDEMLDVNWPWRGQPSLIACWSRPEVRTEGWEEYYMYAENFNPEDEDNLECIARFSPRVWHWKSDGECSGAFFFAVPVFSLRDERDIKKHVIKPLKNFFEGKGEDESFPEDSPSFLADHSV